MTRWLLSLSLVGALGIAYAEEPYPIPLTRPAMKVALEKVKERKPRFELPTLTAEELKLDERARGYEGRLRSVYLSDFGDGRGAFGFGGGAAGRGDPDPDLTLENRFKVKLFWIVSRTNNCLY